MSEARLAEMDVGIYKSRKDHAARNIDSVAGFDCLARRSDSDNLPVPDGDRTRIGALRAHDEPAFDDRVQQNPTPRN
jgi:hypothetical protein